MLACDSDAAITCSSEGQHDRETACSALALEPEVVSGDDPIIVLCPANETALAGYLLFGFIIERRGEFRHSTLQTHEHALFHNPPPIDERELRAVYDSTSSP